jgi:hypothetical protein
MLALRDSGPVPLLMAVRGRGRAPVCRGQTSPRLPRASAGASPARSVMQGSDEQQLVCPQQPTSGVCGQRQLVLLMLHCCLDLQQPLCHTRFWKANRIRTMYVPGSETHVQSDYIIGHHHTRLELNNGKVLNYIKMSKTSTESIT